MTKMAPTLLSLWPLLFGCVALVSAAHSRRRPGVVRHADSPRYDRSITTFSEDGRLLQVEYGLESSRRGDLVVAFQTENQICIAVSSSDKVHRLDAHILMVTSGLVGDGRALASALQTECQRFRLNTGEAPSVKEVARMTAELQHALTRRAGARPLGCTAILAGLGDSSKILQIFQTDPGGIMEECHYCAAGKGQDKALESLHRLLEELEKKGDANLIDIIKGVAQIALENSEIKSSHVDVWILQGDDSRRGGLSFKCVQGLTQGTFALINERLAKLT